MTFHIKPMTVAAAQAIDQWHYPGEYSFYDLDADPQDRAEFLDPSTWEDAAFAVETDEQELMGFFLFQPDGDTLVLGLGMHPNHTGRGKGEAFIRAGLEFADRHYQPETVRLSVATFNRRAIRVYERVGFVAGKIFMQQTNGSEVEFVEMTRHGFAQRNHCS